MRFCALYSWLQSFLFLVFALFIGAGCDKEGSVSIVGGKNKSWSFPANVNENISPDGTAVSGKPTVSMSDNGSAALAWIQHDGTRNQVYISTYINNSWNHPTSLANAVSPSTTAVIGPLASAGNNSGDFIIVWIQNNGTNNQVFKSEYRGGSWTHPANQSDHISVAGQICSNPDVAMDDNGNAIIVWQQSNGTNQQIFKSEYRAGSWTHPANAADNISVDGSDMSEPKVDMDNSSNAIIVWFDSTGVDERIFKSEYRSGSWTHPANLADNINPDGDWARNVQVTMDNYGEAMIVWQQRNSSSVNQVFGAYYNGSSWIYPANLDDNLTSYADYANDPSIVLRKGRAVLSWLSLVGFEMNYLSEYYSNTWYTPSSTAEHISPQPAGDVGGPVPLAMNYNYDAIMVWFQADSRDAVFKSEYRNGSWTHPVDENDFINPAGTDASVPDVAMDNDGNTIIVWRQSDGVNNQTFIAEYR
ncbi:MAG: hypothetical protein MJE63_12295 [Proteobacteria bacterium]|nr:hypothetical protein [Pseudomonadota bacterium]